MKLTKIQKRNCILTEDDVNNIRREYEMCHNYSLLARQYNVSRNTIKYWINEDYRQKYIERNRDKILSEEQRLRKNTNARSSKALRISTFDGYGSDILKQQKEYYSKNKEQIRERHKEYYSKNKEQINERKKEQYHKNKDYIRQRYEDNKK